MATGDGCFKPCPKMKEMNVMTLKQEKNEMTPASVRWVQLGGMLWTRRPTQAALSTHTTLCPPVQWHVVWAKKLKKNKSLHCTG